MSVCYDRDGEPIDLYKWAELIEDGDYKIVEQTLTESKNYLISTVWLGIDYDFSYAGDTPNPNPIIFETMVFDKRPEKQQQSKLFPDRTFSPDLDMRRYCTEADALAGHESLVKKYKLIEDLAGKLTVTV